MYVCCHAPQPPSDLPKRIQCAAKISLHFHKKKKKAARKVPAQTSVTCCGSKITAQHPHGMIALPAPPPPAWSPQGRVMICCCNCVSYKFNLSAQLRSKLVREGVARLLLPFFFGWQIKFHRLGNPVQPAAGV